jgi:hypothetical protein
MLNAVVTTEREQIPMQKSGFEGKWITVKYGCCVSGDENKEYQCCEIWNIEAHFDELIEKDGKIFFSRLTLNQINGDGKAKGYVEAENPQKAVFQFEGLPVGLERGDRIGEVVVETGQNRSVELGENRIIGELDDAWYRLGIEATDTHHGINTTYNYLRNYLSELVAYWLAVIASGESKYTLYIDKTAEQMRLWPGVVQLLSSQSNETFGPPKDYQPPPNITLENRGMLLKKAHEAWEKDEQARQKITSEVLRRVARLLAEMSDGKNYQGRDYVREDVENALIEHAVPWFESHSDKDWDIRQAYTMLRANFSAGFNGEWITFNAPGKTARGAMPWRTWEIWKINVDIATVMHSKKYPVMVNEMYNRSYAHGEYDINSPKTATFYFTGKNKSKKMEVELDRENILRFSSKRNSLFHKEEKAPAQPNWYRMDTLGAEDIIRENLRNLVNDWAVAIISDHPKKTEYIEDTAEQMRYWPGVVRYLVYLLSQTFPLENGQVLGKAKSEAEIARSQKMTLDVHRRVAILLAEMSDGKNYKGQEGLKDKVTKELTEHAVPWIVVHLANEGDLDMRRDYATLLANLRTDETIDVLVQAVVSDEKVRASRQELLAKYYLDPSREQGDQAANILEGAVRESRRTLGLLQTLNVVVLLVGMVIVLGGFYVGITNPNARLEGTLAGLGGLAGVVTLLVNDPLDRIQNSLSNLVQLESAFTSFIWELNLNSTYIQSQYVAAGVLREEDVTSTLSHIESAMDFALSRVATYTEEGREISVPRLTHVGRVGDTVTIYGDHLKASGKAKETPGQIVVAINHVLKPEIKVEPPQKDLVAFELTEELLDGQDSADGLARISLVMNGVETNALPLRLP